MTIDQQIKESIYTIMILLSVLFTIMITMFFNTTDVLAQQSPYIWIEAETPDEANFTISASKGALLSNGQWLLESLSKEDVAAGKLKDGRHLKYEFNVDQSGIYRMWVRLGYESVRAPLMWRIDNEEWHGIQPTDLTQNLIELSLWFEVGWLNTAEMNLTQGAHVLEIKADKPGSDGRFLFALDAIAFVQGSWVPEDKLKPFEMPDDQLDRQAADHIFSFPADVGIIPDKRVELSLNGLWQICREDDQAMDTASYEPARDFPEHPRWRGIQVPSNFRSIPALDMAHIVWYRCRVEMPRSFEGRGFFLDFTGTNWIASVLINGNFIGGHKSTRIPWQLDITSAILPGQVNEIMVGIKDVWYAIDSRYHKQPLNKTRNLPVDTFRNVRFVAPVYPTTKGDADGSECGITDPVSLVVTGQIYVEDSFIQTKVKEKLISVDLTLRNTTKNTVQVTVQSDAVFEKNGQIEKRFDPLTVTIPKNSAVKVKTTSTLPDPKFWLPGDDPANMYRLLSVVLLDDKPVDRHEQRFGFREIGIDGKCIRVNGLRYNFWNLLDCLKGAASEEKLAHFRKGNNRFERFSADLNLRRLLGPRRQQLDWTDTHGIPGRLSTMIDGMFINYDLSNPVVWENFREHVQQVVMAYRNHPSVFFYSLENELVLINGRLGYGGILDQVEAEAKRMVDAAHELDSTRPCMLDGAGALKGNLIEINNLHYPEPAPGFFPENAYTLERWGNFGNRWVWDRQRPLAMGEIAFMEGKNAKFAWIGGDKVFLGRSEARKAYAQYVKILLEGYRWSDVAIICPWIGMDNFPECWKAMSPLAAFVREYNTAFFAGDSVSRTIKVFNDTFSEKPVEFSWSVQMGGKRIAGKKIALQIEPGFAKELTITFTAPAVKKRTNARLLLKVQRSGETNYEDAKEIAFFPRSPRIATKKPIFILGNGERLLKFLVRAKPIKGISEADPGGILIVSPDTLTEEQAKSEDFLSYVKNGGCIICLEQNQPYTNPILPVQATKHQANYTFPLGLRTSLFTGLNEQDFSNWAGDIPTAKQVWDIPMTAVSVKSWIACDEGLTRSCLLEMSAGQGIILASQMRIGAKLEIEPAAQRLFANMLRYCDAYKPLSMEITLFAPKRPDIAGFVKSLGFVVKEVSDLKYKNILIVHASKENLESLVNMKREVNLFVSSGGWIMLWGLEPDGLQAYNKLLGTAHLLREFRLERVSIEQDILSAGLGNRDVLQYGTEELMFGDKWLSQEVFTYCVDGEDIAPFCKLPGQKDEPYRPTKDDHDPYNLVNGMTGNDFWKYILQIWYANWQPEGSPPFVFGLPVPCRIKQVEIWNNAFYDTIKDMEIQLDGRPAATIELPDALASAKANLNGKLAQKDVSLIVRSIRKRQDRLPLVGIDNVQIIRELPVWYKNRVFPMVNVGGLVRYPRGKGGFVLNQINLNPQDTPENIAKKQHIVAAILQNIIENVR